MFQSLLQISISVLISSAVWTVTAMALLSLPSKLTGGGFMIPDLPFSESAKYGIAVGLMHGLLTAIVVYWYKSDSVVGAIFSSVAVTEVMIAAGFAIAFTVQYLNQPVSVGKPVPSDYSYIYLLALFIFTILVWYLILSVLFLIPSILIGIANRFFVIPRQN